MLCEKITDMMGDALPQQQKDQCLELDNEVDPYQISEHVLLYAPTHFLCFSKMETFCLLSFPINFDFLFLAKKYTQEGRGKRILALAVVDLREDFGHSCWWVSEDASKFLNL